MALPRYMRKPYIVAGAIIIMVSFAMAFSVDAGLTADWSSRVRSLWAYSLIGGMLVGVLVLMYGLGMVGSQSEVPRVPESEIAPASATLAFIGLMVLLILAGFQLQDRYGIPAAEPISVGYGMLLIVASGGRPAWRPRMIVSGFGWRGAIGTSVRIFILLAGVGFLAFGLLGFGPEAS